MLQRPEKNDRNWSINKATKNRQSSATAKRRASAKGLKVDGNEKLGGSGRSQ